LTSTYIHNVINNGVGFSHTVWEINLSAGSVTLISSGYQTFC